ncbi:hypothetical protein ACFQ4O_01185 [Methylopila musalis]|uniref:Uncharacterized protein n=1 Tax=Methylopila musalis TaxID=1134781 RepID=A0ABW3Z332_9HYPH
MNAAVRSADTPTPQRIDSSGPASSPKPAPRAAGPAFGLARFDI